MTGASKQDGTTGSRSLLAALATALTLAGLVRTPRACCSPPGGSRAAAQMLGPSELIRVLCPAAMRCADPAVPTRGDALA